MKNEKCNIIRFRFDRPPKPFKTNILSLNPQYNLVTSKKNVEF